MQVMLGGMASDIFLGRLVPQLRGSGSVGERVGVGFRRRLRIGEFGKQLNSPGLEICALDCRDIKSCNRSRFR